MTTQEIQLIVAKLYGYRSWLDMLNALRVAEEYALLQQAQECAADMWHTYRIVLMRR